MQTDALIVGFDHVARLQRIALPELTATRVHLRTLISGISCGTEADCTSGRASYMPRPFLSGYQAVAEVVACGALVRNVRPGDRVFTHGSGELWGMTHLGGGSHARELVVEDDSVHRLAPSCMALESASYAGLAAVALEGLRRMRLEPGRTLLVFGLGMLGHLVGRLAQLEGLRVVGVNRSAWKRDAALAFGFDAVCAPEASEVDAAVASLARGPARWAVDTTGSQAVFDLAVRSVGRLGELTLLGYYPKTFQVDFDAFHARQICIHNPVGFGTCVPAALRIIEDGRLDLTSLIRHTIQPHEITAFYRELVDHHGTHLGAMIDWRTQIEKPAEALIQV